MRRSGLFQLMIVGGALLGAAGVAVPARAGGVCSAITLSCENGQTYSLCPISVSDAGDIVTASLALSPRHGAYMRLVPMGVGYRYAGRGIWLDGVGPEAVLNFGNRRAVACTLN